MKVSAVQPRHLFAGIWAARDPQECWMAFWSYYDASGAQNEETGMIAIGGVVAPEAAWSIFESEWDAHLKKWGFTEFSYANFKASEQEFRRWKDKALEPERRVFFGELLDIWLRHVHGWSAISVDLLQVKAISGLFVLPEGLGPYALCAFGSKGVIEYWRDKNHTGEPIAHFFDRDDEGSAVVDGFKDSDVQRVPHYTTERGYVRALEAADLVAGVTRTGFLALIAGAFDRAPKYPLRRLWPKKIGVSRLRMEQLMKICLSRPDVFPRRQP